MASFCQLLQRRYAGQLDERADQYIAFAVDGAQRMQRLINDLLAFSRIGRLTTGFVDVDLNKVMGDVAGQTEAARQYADAELTWTDLPVIRGEEPLLTNLLANLVSNSMKFRRPDVPPKVHVSAPAGRRRVGDHLPGQRHRHRAGVRRQDLRDLPAAARQGRLPGHRHRAGDRQEDRRIPRRPGLGGHRRAEGTAIRFTLPARPEDVEAAAAEAAEQPETAATGEPTSSDEAPADSSEQSAEADRPDRADGAPDSGRTGDMKETVG